MSKKQELVWSEYQKAIFQDVSSGIGNTIVQARAGSSKCLGYDTPVLMFDGRIKPVQDIVVGDLLMGPDSKPKTVFSTGDGYGDLVRIVPVKGDPWICNTDHILTLKGTNHDKGKIADTSVKDFIAFQSFRKDISKNWKLFKPSIISFDECQVPYEPYLLGLWIGDGTTTDAGISNIEPEIIEYCKVVGPKYGYKTIARYVEGNNCYYIRFIIKSKKDRTLTDEQRAINLKLNSQKMYQQAKADKLASIKRERAYPITHLLKQFLTTQCVVDGKKKIPPNYLFNSESNRLQLLAGILDTDGGFPPQGGYCVVVSVIEELANQYAFLARSLGFASYVKKRKTTIKSIGYVGVAWSVSIIGDINRIPCKVARKQAKPRLQVKNPLVNGFKIENIGQGKYYGFTLDGDGRFLLGDFTITHNTTSLVECVKYIPPKNKTLFVAFNKKIATELDDRIDKSYVQCKTLHSVGYTTVRKKFPKIRLDSNKTSNISQNVLRDLGFKQHEHQKYALSYVLTNVVNLCRGCLIDTPSKIDDLMDRFDIDTLEMDRETFIKAVVKILRKCKDMTDCLDFGEMVSFPFYYGIQPDQYDRVFIDEAQDLTPAQLHIALSSCKKNGRILACGDSRQVLYSWAGVDINAMEILTTRLNAKVLTLPISYRCAKSIVKLAQEIVPDIQSAPGASEGIVKHLSQEQFLDKVEPGCFILSRTNAPLIYYCLALLRRGIAANIQGKDVGANLAWMIKKSEKTDVDSFLVWLDDWKRIETKRLISKGRDSILIEDKAACLETLCEGERSLDAVHSNIKKLFNDGDDHERVMLSSTHKAKGLEREIVYLLDWTYSTADVASANIRYVAVSRAKKELYLVMK